MRLIWIERISELLVTKKIYFNKIYKWNIFLTYALYFT